MMCLLVRYRRKGKNYSASLYVFNITGEINLDINKMWMWETLYANPQVNNGSTTDFWYSVD